MRTQPQAQSTRLPRPLERKLLVPVLAFALALALFSLLSRGSEPASAPVPGAGFAGAGRSAEARVRALQTALTREPTTRGYASLGDAYLERVRESGDASFYAGAESAFRAALEREPENAAALAGMGSLALARHDFREALRLGRAAHAAAPEVVKILGVEADALVELGRYREAERVLQRMVDLKPNLASYSRVSYFRELHGDLPGAVEAMRLAVSAGGTPENLAYVRSLLGNLELERGRVRQAELAYRHALSQYRGYALATAGLARVDASRGDLGRATRRLRSLVARLPLPEYVVLLGETELAAGQTAAARSSFELVRVEQRLLGRSGVNTDVELALFEADHGSPPRALELARRAMAAAPSVRSADALGWALTRSGRPSEGLALARQALRLGSRDASFLHHAGMSARAAGRPGLARRYLAAAVARNPRFSPLRGPAVVRALRDLR